MTENSSAGIDTRVPNVARIYDYLLGGKDNFAADREAADMLARATPDIAVIARANRSFIRRAVSFLAGQGIRQFLDLGGGLPTNENVHEVAQRTAPDSRVVYVDKDPVVVTHGQALLAAADRTAVLLADLTRPDDVLSHPDTLRLLDLSEPVGVLCFAALHFVPDADKPRAAIARYRDRLAPGSYLVISHGVPGDEEMADEVENSVNVYRGASDCLWLRTQAEVRRFFDGFDLVDPGFTWIETWRPDYPVDMDRENRGLHGGVGRKRSSG